MIIADMKGAYITWLRVLCQLTMNTAAADGSSSDDEGKEPDPKRPRHVDCTREADVSDESEGDAAGDPEVRRTLPVQRLRLDLSIQGLEDVAKLVEAAENIVVLSGAGVSVSCGVPDFRSAGGVYETVLERFDLADPQAIFDLTEFRLNPNLFYSFAKDIMPSESLRPSPTHGFIAELDRRGKLLRNYSQNIDGLEHRAGISSSRLVLCHGSFLTATCMLRTCRKQVWGSLIVDDVKAGKVPMCQFCSAAAARRRSKESDDDDEDDDDDDDASEWASVMKPDIVFFGEGLPESVSRNLQHDAPRADLVLVLGTSLQVAPVSHIPRLFRDNVPRLLVNRELVGYNFDVELLGNCDVIVGELCRKLGWTPGGAVEVKSELDRAEKAAHEFRPPRRFLFAGAIDDESEEESSEDESTSSN